MPAPLQNPPLKSDPARSFHSGQVFSALLFRRLCGSCSVIGPAVQQGRHVEHRQRRAVARHKCRQLAVPVFRVSIGDKGLRQGFGDLAVRLGLGLGTGRQLIGIRLRFDALDLRSGIGLENALLCLGLGAELVLLGDLLGLHCIRKGVREVHILNGSADQLDIVGSQLLGQDLLDLRGHQAAAGDEVLGRILGR